MPIFDFKEIPSANANYNTTGNTESFEQFALNFMKCVYSDHISINDEISRGADGGKDFIITEIRQGILGKTEIRWLVSCKHYAHSKQAVSSKNEEDLSNRIDSHNCKGFIGFYSTTISPTLKTTIDSLKERKNQPVEVIIFDSEKIEKTLLTELNRRDNHPLYKAEIFDLVNRFFPNSMKIWNSLYFRASLNLDCYECVQDDPFIVGFNDEEYISKIIEIGIHKYETDSHGSLNQIIEKINNVYCFHNYCFKVYAEKNFRGENFSNDSHLGIVKKMSLSDFIIPENYLSNLMLFMENADKYSKSAFDYKCNIFKELFPWVSRENSMKELVEQDIDKFVKDHLVTKNELL